MIGTTAGNLLRPDGTPPVSSREAFSLKAREIDHGRASVKFDSTDLSERLYDAAAMLFVLDDSLELHVLSKSEQACSEVKRVLDMAVEILIAEAERVRMVPVQQYGSEHAHSCTYQLLNVSAMISLMQSQVEKIVEDDGIQNALIRVLRNCNAQVNSVCEILESEPD